LTFVIEEACFVGGVARNAYHTKYMGFTNAFRIFREIISQCPKDCLYWFFLTYLISVYCGHFSFSCP
ncbi:hypothetical protein KI387_032543, partial [Taxus chinensis]